MPPAYRDQESHRSRDTVRAQRTVSRLDAHNIVTLLGVLNQLMEEESTVIPIDHDLDLTADCDCVIDLGPGGAKRIHRSTK